MIFLHRQNIISNIVSDGIEIDVRSHPDGIVLNHDPLDFSLSYPLLKDYIHLYKDKKIIVNVKESGIEEKILKLFNNTVDFYFLDSQIPDIIRLSKKYSELKRRFILRVSDFESYNDEFISFVNPDFLWLDWSKFECFSEFEYLKFINNIIKRTESHPIIVSPELYDLKYLSYIEKYDLKNKIIGDFSVCTKNPELWRIKIDKSN